MDSFIRHQAMSKGRYRGLYRRYVVKSSQEWGEFLRRWGGLHACGEQVSINIGCNITDPYLVKLGNNISLSSCTLLGHDAVVRIINNRDGLKLDSVGPIEILDNSFVGHGAIIMPNVRIGPNAVVAAGSVVTKDVPPGMLVGGIPAKVIGTFDDMVARLKARSQTYPWIELIEQRVGSFDPELEPRLRTMRKAYYFGSNSEHEHQ